ncbi:PQQ-binding-like beta-propeller repeat protein [Paenibacillus sp. DMB20]|uniref:PQQ-binding-like beta-propeller repeat protein n=1 Tax=Paenibacillus sp. DMB20 TaxID=1642570 RepID=UPI000B290087|nr:PQQ-binding-like beta-propeller repeat protein [Paenibacillus sp. DMB20]
MSGPVWNAAGKKELKEPEDDSRRELAPEAWNMIRAANRAGEVNRLRQELPAATWPLVESFREDTQAIKSISFIGDSLIFRAGTAWEEGIVYIAGRQGIVKIPELTLIGRSAAGSVYALVGQADIRLVRNPDGQLQGEVLAVFPWTEIKRKLKEQMPNLNTLADCEQPEKCVEEVIPFSDGSGLMLVSSMGIYLIGKDRAELFHPNVSDLEEYEMDDSSIDMAHGSVSPDERWLAYGSQSSNHLLFDRNSGEVYSVYPESSYPHFSLFTRDGRQAWFNSCHFYNGSTIRAMIDEVLADGSADREEWPLGQDGARVYAAAALTGGVVLGDAYGYLWMMDGEGTELWRHFVGSTISGMAVSDDEGLLAVGTYGGMLHLLDLRSGAMDEYSIGTGTIRERERIIVWKSEDEPLRW